MKNKNENDVVGHAFRYVCDSGVVYNLFSKKIFRHKAVYGVTIEQYHSNLKNCLEDMKSQMLSNNERYIAMPKIACGLDRCEWKDIEQIINDVFDGKDIEILVCVVSAGIQGISGR